MDLDEDLKKMGQPEEPHKTGKPTLLSKYQIPVQHLEFEYVEKCQNGKELEKILHILISGEEGYFPELTTATEKRLGEIKPNSKYLRTVCPVLGKAQINEDEWNDLSKDLAGWVKDVNKKDQELEGRKIIKSDIGSDSEIRKTKGYQEGINKPNPKRISSTDYESWDKYDPDTEILKMDLEDEKLKKEVLKEQKTKIPKTVRFKNFATEAEAIFEANREKERGNECFKANEYQNALQHYTNSLECKPLAVVYTNRALIHNKLKKYKKAIEDCKAALKLDPNNFKAHLRMAQNYETLEEYVQALESIENAIEIDPNNTSAQQLANKIRKACGKTNLNTRLMIEDVQSNNNASSMVLNGIGNQNNIKEETKIIQDNNCPIKPLKSILKTHKNIGAILEKSRGEKTEENQNPSKNLIKAQDFKDKSIYKTARTRNKEKKYELIAIPGSSTMPPPYYKIIYSRDPEIIRRERLKIFYRPMLLHMTTIDVGSDDEYSYNYNETIENIQTQICKEKKSKHSKSINIKDDLDTSHLENFKFNDEEITKENYKQTWNNIHAQNTNTQIEVINSKGGGGEPCNEELPFIIPTEEELQEPYTFIQTWNAVRKDNTYTQQAEILKKMDFKRIHNVIGYKLDDIMLSTIINCLYKHFMVPGELDRLYSALQNLIQIPRFKMMSMFLEESDWKCIFHLIQFLDQHGRSLPNSIKDIYCNK